MHPIDFLKIKTWIEQWNVDYKIGVDGTLDIEDDIEISDVYEKLPYKFGYCNGSFRVGGIGLKTLENCPEYILDYFSCSFNNLTSLKYCPKEVGGDIFMRSCGITEIDYFPKLIDQTSTKFIDLSHNKISELKNLPILYQKKIDYSINISYNKLNSLKGCPDSLLTLECVGNPIKNFKGLKNCKNLICSIDGIENAEDIEEDLNDLFKYDIQDSLYVRVFDKLYDFLSDHFHTFEGEDVSWCLNNCTHYTERYIWCVELLHYVSLNYL